jgi:hypothetical protein
MLTGKLDKGSLMILTCIWSIYIYSPTKVEHHLRAIPEKSVSWGQNGHEI